MKQVSLTARGHDFTTVATIQELAELASDSGIKTVQLALGLSFPTLPTSQAAINPGMGNYFKQQFAQKDVTIGILSCYINMIHPDLTIREENLMKFEQYVAMAHSFGANMVATETGNVYPEIHYTPDNFTEAAFDEMVQVIKRLVKAGERHQTIIGIEPGVNHPLHSLEKVERLIKAVDSPYLGIILDPTNLIDASNYQEQVAMVETAFDKFGEQIVGFHLKDYLVNDQEIVPTALGEGVMDYQAIIQIIEQRKPYLFVVLEETKDEKLRVAVEKIHQA
ncbi:MAG: sugar phosphate isomerase/epimerase family protein [Enterococcus sp.]